MNYNEMTEMESLCPGCERNGTTRLLFCKIPFFGDVVVSSFACPHCFLKNSELQSAKELQDEGKRFMLKVTSMADLQRMVVTSPHCKVMLPELDFEAPNVKKGTVSTVEGLLRIFIEDLKVHQPLRKIQDPENYQKIEDFVAKLEMCASAKAEALPYYFILEDPSGNTFVENPNAPMADNFLKVTRFEQTKRHLVDMGYMDPAELQKDEEAMAKLAAEETKLQEGKTKKGMKVQQLPTSSKQYHYGDKEISEMIGRMHNAERRNLAHKLDKSMPLNLENVQMDERLCAFQVDCFTCFKEGEMRSFQCEIPFFKEIIIMAFKCMHCGYKSSEVKIGGEISKTAKKITICCTDVSDLNRDVFKSDTAMVTIPELDFEMMPGSLGSFYTTIEGLLGLLVDRLEKSNPFRGDSQEVVRIKVNFIHVGTCGMMLCVRLWVGYLVYCIEYGG